MYTLPNLREKGIPMSIASTMGCVQLQTVTSTQVQCSVARRESGRGGGRGGLAQGLGIRLLAFGGIYWPLATAHSDPLWARTCFGRVNGAARMTCPV